MNKLIQAAREAANALTQASTSLTYVGQKTDGEEAQRQANALRQALTEAEQRPSYDELVAALRVCVHTLDDCRDHEFSQAAHISKVSHELLARIGGA